MLYRVASLNVENLLSRYRFKEGVKMEDIQRYGIRSKDLDRVPYNAREKTLTARLIQYFGPRFIGLQEVEGLRELKDWRDANWAPRGPKNQSEYPHAMSIEGNDHRSIELAAKSQDPIVHIRSYQDLPGPADGKLFSRDCLELDVQLPDKSLVTYFLDHFKSMIPLNDADPTPGRAQTRHIREAQAEGQKQIVIDKFGTRPEKERFIIMGDLNDPPEDNEEGKCGIRSLIEWDAVEDIMKRLPPEEQWTHYFARMQKYSRLDYMLPSRAMAAKLKGLPQIIRVGLPLRADRYKGPRLPGIGDDKPKASDHCLLGAEFEL